MPVASLLNFGHSRTLGHRACRPLKGVLTRLFPEKPLLIDIPVKLKNVKTVYSIDALAFEGDLQASVFLFSSSRTISSTPSGRSSPSFGAAAMFTIIDICKILGLNPEAYLPEAAEDTQPRFVSSRARESRPHIISKPYPPWNRSSCTSRRASRGKVRSIMRFYGNSIKRRALALDLGPEPCENVFGIKHSSE